MNQKVIEAMRLAELDAPAGETVMIRIPVVMGADRTYGAYAGRCMDPGDEQQHAMVVADECGLAGFYDNYIVTACIPVPQPPEPPRPQTIKGTVTREQNSPTG